MNPPNLPVVNVNDYDGSNTAKRAFLERTRMVDWKTEWDKSRDMTDAVINDEDLEMSVRLRNPNFEDVIAERV